MTAENDHGVVFENTRGRFGRVVSKNDLEGRSRRPLGSVIYEIVIFYHKIL
jgi:hypothetical protein